MLPGQLNQLMTDHSTFLVAQACCRADVSPEQLTAILSFFVPDEEARENSQVIGEAMAAQLSRPETVGIRGVFHKTGAPYLGHTLVWLPPNDSEDTIKVQLHTYAACAMELACAFDAPEVFTQFQLQNVEMGFLTSALTTGLVDAMVHLNPVPLPLIPFAQKLQSMLGLSLDTELKPFLCHSVGVSRECRQEYRIVYALNVAQAEEKYLHRLYNTQTPEGILIEAVPFDEDNYVIK